MQGFVLKALEEKDLVKLLKHALENPAGFGGQNVDISEEQLTVIAAFANGDARTALNTLEMAVLNGEITTEGITVTREGMEQCISRKSLLYDKTGRSITTSYLPCTNPCGTVTRMQLFTGCAGCWRVGKTPLHCQKVDTFCQ